MKPQRAASSPVARSACGTVGEPPGHLGGRPEVALGVRRETPAQRVERGPEPDGRQDVEDRALAGRRVADAAGGDDGEPGLPRERHGAAGPELALARAVPLELHVDPVPAEAPDEPIERGPRRIPVPGEAVGGERPVLAPGEADEALDRALEVVQRRPRPALRRPGLHAGDEAPERPVPGAGLDEERQARAVGERERGADEGAHARGLRRLVEARRAVDAVHVDEGERGELERAPPPRPGPRAADAASRKLKALRADSSTYFTRGVIPLEGRVGSRWRARRRCGEMAQDPAIP